MTRTICGLLTVNGTRCKNPPGCAVAHHPTSAIDLAGISGAPTADDPLLFSGSDLIDNVGFDTKEGAAQAENASPDALAKFASDPDPAIRLAVAANTATPEEIVERLAADDDPAVRHVTNHVLVHVWDHNDDEDLRAASNPDTPPDEMIKLGRYGSPEVQERVAKNPSAPAAALDAMVVDRIGDPSAWYMNRLVAEHLNASQETLVRLAGDANEDVREQVAANLNTSQETLLRLAGDPNRYVRGRVAESPNASKRALEVLADDVEPWVRGQVAANSNTPKATLALLADDYEPVVYEAAAANPNTP